MPCWWWLEGMGVARALPLGFVCIVLLFFLISYHTPFFSGLTPYCSLLQMWNLGISMTTSIVFLCKLVDCLWSFLKHDSTPYLNFTTSHLLLQVQVAPAPATPMPSNHHREVWGWHLSSVATLFGHLVDEKGLNTLDLPTDTNNCK